MITSPSAPQLAQRFKGCIDVAFGAGIQDMKLQPERAGRRLQTFRYGLGIGIGWIDEQQQSWSPLEPLRAAAPIASVQLSTFNVRHARDIAARPAQAGDEADLHRIADGSEDNGYRRRRRLCRDVQQGWSRRQSQPLGAEPDRPPCAGSRSYWPSAQRYSIATLSALDIAGFAQALAERGHMGAQLLSRVRHRGIQSPASPAAARAPRAATPPPRRAWPRISVVRCGLPCDPPVGVIHAMEGMIPRLHRPVCVAALAPGTMCLVSGLRPPSSG